MPSLSPTTSLPRGLQEYFFPREDESKARAAAAFARSVAVPAAAAARHRRSATALPASGAADYGSHQGSPMPPVSGSVPRLGSWEMLLRSAAPSGMMVWNGACTHVLPCCQL